MKPSRTLYFENELLRKIFNPKKENPKMRISITPTQSEILDRVEMPDTIFSVFEDTEELAGKFSEDEIESYCAQLREQFSSGFLDLSQFANQALVIEILSDCTAGSKYLLYEDDFQSPQQAAAWRRSARNLESKFKLLGLLDDGSEQFGKIWKVRGL